MLGLEAIGGALGLGAGRAAQKLAAALRERVGNPGKVIAVGDDLGRALERAGLDVVVIAPSPKRRRKGPPQIRARADRLPLGDGSVDAVFVSGVPVEGPLGLRELCRVVRAGGLVGVASPVSSLVRKVKPPEEIAASLMHAALVEIEQHAEGSLLISWGRIGAFRLSPSQQPLVAAPPDEEAHA